MIDIILGIIATLICGIGYGTIYFFTAVFWLFVIGKILEHYAVPVEVKVMNDVKGREVYIKIMLGGVGCQTICISFHIAERPLVYPFKCLR